MDKYLFIINKTTPSTSTGHETDTTMSTETDVNNLIETETDNTSHQNSQSDIENISILKSQHNLAVKVEHNRLKKKVYIPNTEKLSKFYNWIDPGRNVPFCKLCNTTIKGGKFHLKRHESKNSHIKHVEAAKKCVLITEAFNPDIQKEFLLVKEAELRMCAFICDKNLALLLVDSLPSFNKSIYPDSRIAQNIHLKRKKATQLIVGVMAPAFREELYLDLRTENFSIIIDETTDVSTKKSLTVIVRYWKNGRVQDRFLNLVEVSSSTAESLFHAVMELLHDGGIPIEKVVGFGADNASTMMGNINGVKARFQEVSPHIYIQGCSCHSLHLCASAAANVLPGTVEQFTRDIYSYFSQSNKRLKELKECQIFADEKPTKMLRPSQTRWLSLKAVVDRILEHWNSLTLFFQRAALEENLPNARSILSALNNNVFKLYLLFLAYVLDLVTKVNIELQSEAPKLPIILNRIETLYKTILRCFIKNNVRKEKDFKVININDPTNYVEIEKVYIGAKSEIFLKSPNFHISKEDLHNFYLRVLEFYVELCKQIKKRFNFDDKYLKFAAYFIPDVALSGDKLSIAEFTTLFPNIELDIEAANIEWQMLSDIHLNTTFVKKTDLVDFWKNVSEQKNVLGKDMFPNLMIIVKIILSLPHSSAAAERSFSQLSLIKTSIRNKLLIRTCASILSVKDKMNQIPGGSLEWRPDKTCTKYNENTLSSVNVED